MKTTLVNDSKKYGKYKVQCKAISYGLRKFSIPTILFTTVAATHPK